MRRVGGPVRLIAARDGDLARREVDVAEHAGEGGEGADGLVKGHFVAGFVHAQEAEVAVLAHLAVLGAVDDEGRVAGGAELGRVDVVDLEGDGLAAEPVADVVGVAVDQGYPDGIVEDCFEVGEEIGIDEVARLLECIVDVVVRFCVIQVDAESSLDRREVEVVDKVSWRRGIIIWVTDTNLVS